MPSQSTLISYDAQWMFTIAENAAQAAGWSFAPGCREELLNRFQVAVALHTVTELSAFESEITLNIRRLVMEMIGIAKGAGVAELQKFTLSGAVAKRCPLYPIC